MTNKTFLVPSPPSPLLRSKCLQAICLLGLSLAGTGAAMAQNAQVCSTDVVQTFGNTSSHGERTMSNDAALGPAIDNTEGSSSYEYGMDGDAIIRGPSYYYRVTNPRKHQSWPGWLNGTDHTGDAGGYFLLYDGFSAGMVAYSYDFNDLVAGAEYTASVWIANVFTPGAEGDIPGYRAPNLTVRIINRDTDEEVGRYDTGDIASSPTTPSGTLPWVEYSFRFNADADLSHARLEVINNTAAPYGGDFAIDDVSIKGDCHAVAPVAPTPVPVLGSFGLLLLGGALAGLGATRMRRKR